MDTEQRVQELQAACAAWQGGRQEGSSPLRAAARVVTGTRHYFEADFITQLEREAASNPLRMAHARVLLDELARQPARTVAQWAQSTGIETSWVGRGIASGPQDAQIMRALASGTIEMPLWGVSMDQHVAREYGNRFLFELTGAFPAIAAWQASGIKPNERELITGGRYEVMALEPTASGHLVRLRHLAPVAAK